MRKPTFEQAMRLTLGNLHITKVIDDEYPVELWQAAYLTDKKDIDKFLDAFCEDMAFLSNRLIHKASYLDGVFNLFRIPKGHQDIIPSLIKNYYAKTIKVIDKHINEVIDNMQCTKTKDISVKPFPFSKIRRYNKKNITASFPLGSEELTHVVLKDPSIKNIDDIKKPKHVLELLDKLNKTHYDYQPYILDDGEEKLLVIRLGNDWNDIAIARWEPSPIVRIDTIIMTIFALFMSLGLFGFWYNGIKTNTVGEIVILILSIISISIFISSFFVGFVLSKKQ